MLTDALMSENCFLKPVSKNLQTDLDGELGSSTQYAMLKQEIEEPQAPIEKPQLQRTAIPLVLSSEEYAGPLNFEVLLDPNGAKQPWVVSRKLFAERTRSFSVCVCSRLLSEDIS